MITSAERLEGMSLENGWRVLERVPRSPDATGSKFSVGYIVESATGRLAFLKALDFSRAFAAPDPSRMIQSLTEAFNFERDVLKKCRGLDRVVTAIDDGLVRIEGALDGGVVHYLIFELAQGDVRSQAVVSQRFDIAWSLRCLHHVATGLKQLHSRSIAHQDLKPSNVLVYSRHDSRLADLGRAAYQGHSPPHEDLDVAGDPAYAPPELLYHSVVPGWHPRRCGCDIYLLGSMVMFFFTGMGTTAHLAKELDPAHSWNNWQGTYSEVLPFLHAAFGRILVDFKGQVDPTVRDDMTGIVKDLCEPDPALRGHPRNRNHIATQYSLERYVSRFDLLARRAEAGLRSKN